MAAWTGSALADPRNLLPVDPANEPDLERVMAGLAWYETRGFSPDGTAPLLRVRPRAGMINVSIHMLDLATRERSRVTYDEGVAEGAVFAPDGGVLYTGTTRARDPAFLTMVSGPGVPPFLGFVATPTLHDVLAAKRLALIGNGDVLRMDSTYGLRGRIVGNRKKLAKKLNAPVPGRDLPRDPLLDVAGRHGARRRDDLRGRVERVLLERRPRRGPAPGRGPADAHAGRLDPAHA